MRPWEILDPAVLKVIKSLDRADFVRDSYKGLDYADCRIPCGQLQHTLLPTYHRRQIDAGTDDDQSDSILEIGSGSGYITALSGYDG